MCDVILFGGTDEGHKIADFLRQNNISHTVCVATEYGAEILGGGRVRVGRMDAEEMKNFFDNSRVKLVVDATHPYAEKVTENIKASCSCKYIRVLRSDSESVGRSFPDAAKAAEYLKGTSGNILITTGSKELWLFSELRERAYARVLPSAEALELCRSAGFFGRHVMCMQGPFSKELNGALIREFNIKYLVTKRSGKSGGFEEKIDAAREMGAESVIIERPKSENGISVEEAEKLILELI